MADEPATPAPVVAPKPDHSSIYVGVLVTLIWAGLAFAVLFAPRPAAVTDAIVQQILTAGTAGWTMFLGWLWGSSAGSRAKDSAITNLAAK